MISNKTDDFKKDRWFGNKMDEFQTKWMISNKMDDFKQRGVLQEYAVNLGKKVDIFGTRL
ncbi:hypothetical protein [Methanosarcina barkeri]|uniref:hypothetical protein n=1 Tax=Methanosarcina barkeri TaxID=2208 RepID=UPI00064F413F|nr:hypothetical protein [Methanosarcina barkeri]